MKPLCMWGCGQEGLFAATSYYGRKEGKMKCSHIWQNCPAKQTTLKELGQKVSKSFNDKSLDQKDEIKQKRLSTLSELDENGISGFTKNAKAVAEAKRLPDGTFSGSAKMVATKRNNKDENGNNKFQQAAIKTAITRFGQYAGLKGKTDFEIYRYWVAKITEQQPLHLLENIELRAGYGKSENPFQLDHKFSIVQGFLNNIPPFIIGHISNLEMLPSRLNNSKGSNCSISMEDLFIAFERSYRQIQQ